MKIFSILLILAAFVLSVAGQKERFVKPVDEAKKDASFLAFRTKLIAAAERKDTKHILSILDPKIQGSFGGHEGIADFKELWDFESKETKFWDEFLAVIKNGGNFQTEKGSKTGLFIAPYSFGGFPEDLDAFDHSVVFGNNVNLRDKPAMDAKVLDRLSYNIAIITDSRLKPGSEEDADWYQVKTLGGKNGWVKAEYVRSPIDYRAGFEKKRGVWKMTFFIAGD